MDCKEFKNLIFDFIDDELDENQKAEFEKHKNSCIGCETEFNSFLSITNSVKELKQEKLPDGYCKRLNEKLEIAKKELKVKKRNTYIKFAGVAATFMIVASALFVGGGEFLRNDSDASFDMATSSEGVLRSVDSGAMPQAIYDVAFEEEAKESMDYDMETDGYADVATTNSDDGIQSTKTETSIEEIEMDSKIIKSGSLNVETEDFDNFMLDIENQVEFFEGYIEHSETYVSHYSYDNIKIRSADLVLRVPQEQFEKFVGFVENSSEVSNKSINEEDVTKHYYDMKNIVVNLEAQEQRLRELYDEAQTITEILEIERELNRIRTEIDYYNISLKDIDYRSDMSVLTLSVSEVLKGEINYGSDDLWTRAKEGFIDTINGIIRAAEDFIVFLIANSPIIVMLVVVIVIVLTFVRKKLKKKNK